MRDAGICARWERKSRGTACVSVGLSPKYRTGHGLVPKPLPWPLASQIGFGAWMTW